MEAHARRTLILNYIRNFCTDQGRPPTPLQIRVGLRLRSNNLLNADLQAMVRAGRIARTDDRRFAVLDEEQGT